MSLKPIDFYDANKWDFVEGRDLEDREKKAMRIIAEFVQIKKAKTILDVGCGNGFFLSKLQLHIGDKKLKYFGADYSAYMIKSAKKLHADMTFKTCNLEESIPYDNGSMDVIFCGEVLEHIYNPDKAVEEFSRVLTKGGLLVLTTPNLHTWYNRILFTFGVQPIFYETSTKSATNGAGPMKRLKQQDVPVGHIRLFNRAALTDILESEGFEIVGFKGARFHGLPRTASMFDKIFTLRPNLASNLVVVARKAK